MSAVDLFAGPGGWSLACRWLEIPETGIENDRWTCETRRAAGLCTIAEDVRRLAPSPMDPPRGLIASPPCTPFSQAGDGEGRKVLDALLRAVELMALGQFSAAERHWRSETTGLVLEPLRWVRQAMVNGHPYRWLALEQTPRVLPIWSAMAEVLEGWGYSVAVGNLQAEQYGVPQTRKRAVLVARLGRDVSLPTPTHSRFYPRAMGRLDQGVKPWVSMAEALGWDLASLTDVWPGLRPSPTIVGTFRPDIVAAPGWRKAGDGPRQNAKGSVQVTVSEAARLQSFPADFPWQGPESAQRLQIGNAVPPLLAEAILKAVAW
jgi:DNA (cytosine-5)-methyltransferase 1